MFNFKNYTNAPKTRLNSIKILKREEENWSEYIKNMSRALEEMRVNYDRAMMLKNIENASNPLLKRRLERNQTTNDVKRRQLDGGTIGKLSSRKNSSPNLKRVFSAPASKNPLTAFYYTSNLKDQLPNDSEETFLTSSFSWSNYPKILKITSTNFCPNYTHGMNIWPKKWFFLFYCSTGFY